MTTNESRLDIGSREYSYYSIPPEITALLIDAARREDVLRRNGASKERITQDFSRQFMAKLATTAFRHRVSIDDILQGESPRTVSHEMPISLQDEAKLDDLADKLGSYELARQRLNK